MKTYTLQLTDGDLFLILTALGLLRDQHRVGGRHREAETIHTLTTYLELKWCADGETP